VEFADAVRRGGIPIAPATRASDQRVGEEKYECKAKNENEIHRIFGLQCSPPFSARGDDFVLRI
jgi:hypothetical protein